MLEMQFLPFLFSSCLLAQFAIALRPIPVAPPIRNTASLHVNGSAFFDQLLDHQNPELGTFRQRYWWSTEWWKGPGSPIIVIQPGEANAEGYLGYLTNKTISGLYAQEFGGAVIILEHRYYGQSSPFESLTSKTLQYLTIENAIQDAIHFAKNAKLPFDRLGGSNADSAPWIMVGGSYSGALAGWTAATAPGTYWAYHASSAPVEAIWDYWQYFVPIQQGMPKNCSKDLTRLVQHIDHTLAFGDRKTKQKLKDKFQLGSLEDDDFAEALVLGPYQWQVSRWSQFDDFYTFCDYIENAHADPPSDLSPNGVGVKRALEGYIAWWNEVFFPGYCERMGFDNSTDPLTTSCLDTHDADNLMFTDTSVDNAANRQWWWILCNEPFASWQDGAPIGIPSIVSRFVTDDYWHRQCGLFFPEEDGYTYASARGKRPAALNKQTHGWFGKTERLLWVQGQYDPWIMETVSSPFRPGGPKQSTPEAPIYILPNASHCFDLILENGQLNEGVQDIIDKVVAQMKAWLDEWYEQNDR